MIPDVLRLAVWLLAQIVENTAALPPVLADLVLPASAPAMLLAFGWMVFTGRLVPARTVAKIEQDRDYWRQVALKALGQSDRLLSSAEVATRVLGALPDAADVRGPR